MYSLSIVATHLRLRISHCSQIVFICKSQKPATKDCKVQNYQFRLGMSVLDQQQKSIACWSEVKGCQMYNPVSWV